MVALWLTFFYPFARQQESENEKALSELTRRRTGVIFQRYDTNVDGKPIPQQNWCAPCSKCRTGPEYPSNQALLHMDLYSPVEWR
jgi:hypothetical protein